MEHPLGHDRYEQAKEKAKKMYASIRSVWCPALDGRIFFTRIGFQHLIRRKNTQRPKSEQIRRFALIAETKEILAHRQAQFSKQTKEFLGHTALFWIFTAEREGEIVTVVISEDKRKRLIFLSVYSKKAHP